MSVIIEKKRRKYFPENFSGEDGEEVGTFLKEMLDTEISSSEDLIALIEKFGEMNDILEEVGAWKEIRMTQFADDQSYAKMQADFYEFVIASNQPLFVQLDRKIYESEFFAELPRERYGQMGKIVGNEIELYREENIPLFVKENELAGKYNEIYSQLTVQFEGEEKTIDQMDLILKDKDRDRREKAWRLVYQKFLEKRDEFEKLFDEMKKLRVEISKNAGFANYRDYKHQSLERFDYSPEDLLQFHKSVREAVLPQLQKLNRRRREILNVEVLRPWDMSAELDGKVLRPFSDVKDLLAGSMNILNKIDPEFGDVLAVLSENSLLDLPNRKGKAQGGYCCPLPETGAAFIFMNAIGTQDNVRTLLHESGHSLHDFYVKNEKILVYKDWPMEVAEISSMSMELFTLDYLDEFYKDSEDIKKAKREQLEDCLSIFSGVAVGDAFQHWVYLNPECLPEERDREFARLKGEFSAEVDWSGLEKEKEIGWLRVHHFFEVPFYYIEYAISQLGAIALYKQYKENPKQAIENYKKFLKLGYSKSVPEIYAAAGIKFDFSKEYLQEMADFVMEELEKVK
ncbi:MAG: M3 family oligoendopeptidase [Patescibacteria group bacterium]